MEFSRNWLGEYVELPVIEALCRGLSEIGLTEEGRREQGDDVLLTIDVTANRPDCMSYVGLAREVAVRFDRRLRLPDRHVEEGGERSADAVRVELADGAGCPRYAARVVRGVTVGQSPAWLRRRLEAIGARSINNVVDVTNFVLWETGQPIHAFDLAKIAGGEIVVRRAVAGEHLVTLDGERRQLDPEILVIADAERPVALAGIMGGRDTEVTAPTTDILIESAHFDPATVRRGARRLGMRTDASQRFERGADPAAPPAAATRVAKLIADLAGGEVLEGIVDARAQSLPGTLYGRLDHRRLQAFGGVEIAAETVERILQGLGFELTAEGEGIWRVAVPSWRYHDMKYVDPAGAVYEADLFEEVLRHVGFANVPSALPPVAAPDPGSSAAHRRRQRLRRYLAACGLAEAIHYAFRSATEDGRFGLWCAGEPIRLVNPLSELYAVMRRSLMGGLLASAELNQRRGADAVGSFETGCLFLADGREVETVGLVLGGTHGTPWERATSFDLFDLKGCVEGLAAQFGIALEARAAALPGVVPGTGATLHVGNAATPRGWIGQLAATDSRAPLFGAELEIGALEGGARSSIVVAPSRFPAIAADLTLTHDRTLAWREIDAAIAAAAVPDLVAFGLKDRYSGRGVPAGAVNTTIFFVYNAEDRSLTQDEVNARHGELTASLEARFGRQEG